MKFGKTPVGQHDVAVPKRTERQDTNRATPLRGLFVMLGSCVLFLVFLVLLTVAIHFIML